MMIHGADVKKLPPVPQLYSASQLQPTTSPEEVEFRTLWADAVHDWMDVDSIRNIYFRHIGREFSNIKIIRGKSKTYWLIEFPSRAIAESVLLLYNCILEFPVARDFKIRLNWAPISCFGSGGEIEQLQSQEDDDDLVASDMGTTGCILQQEEDTFTTHRQGGVPVLYPLYPDELEEGKHGSDSKWEDMFEYWRNIDQTTRPVAVVGHLYLTNVSGPPQIFRDLAEKKESKSVDDVAQRVSEIATFFEMPDFQWEKIGITSTKFEDLLDELQGYARSIDVANALHSIDRLSLFLGNLNSSCAGIRAKAAEVLTTMIQYDSRSQQLIMEVEGCGELLMYNFYADPDATSRINALGAISALLWDNVPGVTGFQVKDFYIGLKNRLLSEGYGFQRKALNLIYHLLHEFNSECYTIAELGFPHILMDLAFGDVAEVRQDSLRCLIVLVRAEEGGNNDQLVKNDVKLKLFHQLLDLEYLCAITIGEERELMYLLWNHHQEICHCCGSC